MAMPRKKKPIGHCSAVIFAKDVGRVEAFYAAVLGVTAGERDDDHVVLDLGGIELVVHQLSRAAAARIEIATPPVPRANTAIKPVFVVPSLERARTAAAAHGGALKSVDEEWTIRGEQVCDGIDPEGNVIQFRQSGSK